MPAASATTRRHARVEDSPKRIRILFAGRWVADSTAARLVWEHPWYPTYYLPAADVRTDLLVATDGQEHAPGRGTAGLHSLKVDGREATEAVLWYTDPEIDELRDHLRFEWEAMDGWFEEDEEVHVHPRDPYKRIDILQSSRHVRVEVDGVTVAEGRQPRLLFETGLPTRYYLPKTDVRMDLLCASDHRTRCPYKGTASYYDLEVDNTTYENFVWWYPTTTHESAAIAGYVCFFNEKVDLIVDGEHLERPRTPFS